MKLGIISPIWMQELCIYKMTLSNFMTRNSPVQTSNIFVFNRQRICTTEKFVNELLAIRPSPAHDVFVLDDKERSVAGAWNAGISFAKEIGCELFLVIATDVGFHPKTIENMIGFLDRNPNVDLCSAVDYNVAFRIDETRPIIACDFSCFMFRGSMIDEFGWFDKEYKPAYFEDNDYITRVVLGGGQFQIVPDAVHYHIGSATKKWDAEAAHHINYWFEHNRNRYISKWGHNTTDDYNLIRKQYNKSPCNSGKPLNWWPEQDRNGYSVCGGVHE